MKNGKPPADPLDHTREAISELEGSAWKEEEPTGQTHVHAAPGATVVVEQTGKFKALAVTRPDASPGPISQTPERVRAAKSFLEVFPGWGRVVVAVAVLVVVGLAIWKGVSLPGLP